MPVSPKRILAVTAALLAVGAVCGAVLGMVILTALGIRFGDIRRVGDVWGPLAFAAGFGAAIGAIVTPILAWIFLRRVPLGRAIAETTLGLLAGVALAMVFAPAFWLPAALLGFVVAAVRLFVTSRRAQAPAAR